MGWWRVTSSFILARNTSDSKKWIDDSDAVDRLAVLHVFGQKLAAAGLLCRVNNERIPKRKTVETMQVDGRQDVLGGRLNDMETREHINLMACQPRIEAQFSRRIYEVLLQHLQRNYSALLPLMVQHQLQCTNLLCWVC